MNQPSRSAFWRFILATTVVFAFMATWNLFDLAQRLNVDILSRKSWLAPFLCLGLFGLTILSVFLASFFKSRDQLWNVLESPGMSDRLSRWVGISISFVALTGFSFVTALPGFIKILGNEDWVRIFIFWLFSLLGMWGIKMLRKEAPWFTAWIAMTLCQSVFHLLLIYWSGVTAYPFAMGWSETSRFYFPSLFLSSTVYGQKYPWPILHPTLHILLSPPYLFNAPLWVHRFWQVAIRYILTAAVVPVVMKRLSIQDKATRWLVALWIFLFLFMGPVYFHLIVPVIIILIGFSNQDDRRSWFVVLLASIWCGWSRVNWYPVPGMMAAVLYLLEVPMNGKSIWRYLLKPALWFMAGTLTAFAFQRVYIALSGVPDSNLFYTSINSSLLWYRLLPNASYPPGILLSAILASIPIWLVLYIVIREHKAQLHPVRLIFIFAALLILFLGGLVVSLKIGGGADLHNMDAYFIILLIVFVYSVFGRYQTESGQANKPVLLHWSILVLLIAMPAWLQLKSEIDIKSFDEGKTNNILAVLQSHVDTVNSQGGEVLFITQRHLISMHMLKNVTLIPEYEREDLMEMAMGDNAPYLEKFQSDMESQRFALIVVDPLYFFKMSSRRSFAEENNVWVTRVAKYILCNYRAEETFPDDGIALYVPQEGTRQCP